MTTRGVLSPGNGAKPCKFRYVKPVQNVIHTADIAIDREKSNFRRPHSHVTRGPHQRTPPNIGTRLIEITGLA